MAKITITTTRPSTEVPWFEGTLSDRIAFTDNLTRLGLVTESITEPPVSFLSVDDPTSIPPGRLASSYEYLEKVNQVTGTVESLQEFISFIERDSSPQKIYNDSVGIVRTISQIIE